MTLQRSDIENKGFYPDNNGIDEFNQNKNNGK